MLLNKFDIRMAAIAGLVGVRRMSHRLRILTWQDIMFSVTIKTTGCPLLSLHDHLGMKALLIFLFRLGMASGAVDTLIRSLLPSLGMGIVLNTGMAVRAGELPMD
jgi:hypothetical protein